MKTKKSPLSFKYTKKQLKSLLGAALITTLVVGGVVGHMPFANAQSLQEQIDQLNAENAKKREAVASLRDEAASVSEAIKALSQQITGLQSEIATKEQEKAALEQQITEAEAELARQKELLGQNIRAMYVEGDISTIEMLASSKDLSEFVDKQQYRDSVKRKITDTLAKINDLKHQLKGQKEQVENLIKEKQSIQVQVEAQKNEQNRLLGLNQAEQATLNSEMKQNSARVIELKRQQAIENARLFGGGSGGVIGGGGYPWGSAVCIHTGRVDGACDNYDWSVNGSIWNWSTGGWGYRNCTDWVAFRSGGRIPSAGTMKAYVGSGHAKYWDDAGQAMGRRVSRTPQNDDVAVSNAGDYGHVMYVENVNADGSIFISDYNRAGTGKYATTTLQRVGEGQYRNPSNGVVSSLYFVTF